MRFFLVATITAVAMAAPMASLCAALVDRSAMAFYYGEHPPWAQLRHFDRVVLEPDHVSADGLDRLGGDTRAIAYLSIGEAPAGAAPPPGQVLTRNPGWDTPVMDLTAPGWRARVLERASSLAGRGYAGLFLDTLDSYRLAPDKVHASQTAALESLVREIARRHPDLELWLNRGFEILPALNPLVAGVVAESLYQQWLPANGTFAPVLEADRQWLLERLRRIREAYELPVVVVDYVPEERQVLARETARRIAADGFVPYVSVPALDMVGIGAWEPVPRRILVVYDAEAAPLQETPGFEAAGPILEYLGFAPEYRAVGEELPAFPLTRRYAGVVAWFTEPPGNGRERWERWLQERVIGRVPLVMLGDPAIDNGTVWRSLGMASTDGVPGEDVELRRTGPLGQGFEGTPRAQRLGLAGLHSVDQANQVHLALADGERRWHALVTGPWGGLAASPYVLEPVGETRGRWLIDPFAFFTTALGDPAFPVPDPTTENGMRILTAHIDGDAFVSRAAYPGTPYTAEVIRDRILTRHTFPHTVSVVEGEIGPDGLYPDRSPALEAIARSIFRLDHVEAGSHSYSHPFDWAAAAEGKDNEDGERPGYGQRLVYGVHLPIPGYEYDVQREIAGSARYMEQRLLPADKRVRVFQWTGDAWPNPRAVKTAYEAGLKNINGGNSVMTESFPSLTGLSPLVRPTTGGLQFLAPIINENVFTNNWQGPYYGYRRVVETYRLTGAPRRLRPVSLYYHFYSGANPAGIEGLRAAYAYAEAQPLLALWISEYVERLRGFYEASLSRSLDGGRWQVRDLHGLRTLRLPEGMPWPAVRPGTGVAGGRADPVGRYLTLGAEQALLEPAAGDAPGLPGLYTADAPLAHWHAPGRGRVEIGFRALGPVTATFDRPGCLARTESGTVRGETHDGRTRLRLDKEAARRATVVCP